MIGVSWNYPISQYLFEEVEARSGNVAAGYILLESVLPSRNYVPYCWPYSSVEYILFTEPSNHATGRQRLSNPVFSPSALLHSTTSCWYADAQYRQFCEWGGALNTNHFSSVHKTLSTQTSWNVNQNSHADVLASLLAGKKTLALCGLKAYHFKFFRRTFHTVPVLGFNLLQHSRMWLL